MADHPFYIAVCDDDNADKEQIVEMTEEVCKLENIDAQISGYSSAEEILEKLKMGKQYDMLLLDVMMDGQDGIELAWNLRRQEQDSDIVFISNNREMALMGYEVDAARYLSKPLDKNKLKEAVVFCYGRRQKAMKEILLPVKGGMKKLSPNDIYYIEIVGRKSHIRMEKEEWDALLSISKLEDMLSGYGFFRCHQSFLVNSRYVYTFRTSSIEMTDGKIIPVSKHRIKEVRKVFFDYMKD